MWKILRGLVCVVAGVVLGLGSFVGAGGEGVEGGDGGVGELVISAVNAGYTEGGVGQNYDFIEIFNTTGAPVLMDGYRVEYVNSLGDLTGVVGFEIGAYLNAEYLVLGFGKSPQYAGVDGRYVYGFGGATGLASTGGMVRIFGGEELVDEVCWGGVVCGQNYAKFNTTVGGNMTIRRCVVDGVVEECGEGRWFELVKYYAEVDEGALYFGVDEEVGEGVVAQCAGLVFSEVYSYFEGEYGEQFVEIFNPTDEVVVLEGCGVGYKNRVYGLVGELGVGEYLDFRDEGLKLAKNPSSSGEVVLVDVDGSEVARVVYYHGQKRGTAWAYFEEGEVWRQTYAVTPGGENVYQEFRSCAAGKVINPRTGNCIGFFEEEVPDCPAGKFRNPETNRCRKVEAVVAELKPCADGYERNPETNRCRKVRVNNGADYGVSGGTVAVGSTWVGYGALAVIVGVGLGYVGWQFRDEVRRGIMKVMRIGKRRR